MSSSNPWPCPFPLYVNDVIEAIATTGYFVPIKMKVKRIRSTPVTTFADCEVIGNSAPFVGFTLDLEGNDYVWRRSDDVDTLPCFEAAKPASASKAEYGVHCSRCNVFCEHAEKKPGFVCYGCRV